MKLESRAQAGVLSLLTYSGISFLSSLPQSSLPSGIPDVIPHGFEYFLLAIFLIQAFRRPANPRTALAALVLLAVLALLDELHQLLTPGRVFSWLDILYDLAGSLAGLAAFLAISGRSQVKREK